MDLVIPGRERDLGGFHVRRVLPCAMHQMVGPFIFFDHMGPARFDPGQGIDVRPHPHINLATVTYLFEGIIRHRDSLGSNQLIEPGAINWMTAGHGIVHSERTPSELKVTGSKLSGIQCWVALPDEHEEITPSFIHYPADHLPKFNIGNAQINLLIGSVFGYQSPVATLSELFYLHVKLTAGTKLNFPAEGREAAAYIVAGNVRINEQSINPFTMIVNQQGDDFIIEALTDSEIMLLGGKPVGKRYIYWNFVASSIEKIEQAKMAWRNGPGSKGSRFAKIEGDDQEFIPLPDESKESNPKGTIM